MSRRWMQMGDIVSAVPSHVANLTAWDHTIEWRDGGPSADMRRCSIGSDVQTERKVYSWSCAVLGPSTERVYDPSIRRKHHARFCIRRACIGVLMWSCR